MNAFIALLRKDWRVNLAPIVALLIATVMPYMFAYYFYLYNSNSPYEHMWSDYLEQAAVIGLCVLSVLSAAFGGTTFANERKERSADFLAVTPAPRWQIVASKLIVSVACLLAAWTIHTTILIESDSPFMKGWNDPGYDSALIFTAASLGMFGISYLFSTFLESAATAACIAIGIVAACGITAAILGTFESRPYAIFFLGTLPGLLLTAAGSVYYARRVAP